eukprot:scaffold926_cov408-Prasinococcus_capsulatus_cf.AAC.11
MAQRIPKWEFESADEKKDALLVHHDLMVAAMKAKQSADPASADTVDAAIAALAALPMYA